MKSTEDKQEYNKKIHIAALSATKLGDGLVDPKLVLSWLLSSLGASVFWIGLLVPVREAGALLPQLITANILRRVQIRKWWWVVGSFIQGVTVLAIAVIALLFSGDVSGFLILVSLSAFAIARSICSVSYKDVLGKTVEKQRRGLVTGTASSIAGFGVLIFGLLLLFGVFEQRAIVFSALFLASVLWLIAAFRFSTLDEEASVVSVSDTESVVKRYLRYLTEDIELQKLLVVRGLLTATAVAPPFILVMAESENLSLLSQLGGLVVASSLATFLSGRIWGKLSDKSSSLVLAFSGLSSVVFLLISLWGMNMHWNNSIWFLPVVICGVMISYQGVRIARSIHLVNLAKEESRATYTAISNTIIGVVLLSTGFLGVFAEIAGIEVVIWLLIVMSFAGGVIAFNLKNP